MVFERLADIVTGAALVAELVACVGVVAKLSQQQKAHSVALIRAPAERTAAETADSHAREWGTEFLVVCQQIEVDMADQAQRWACLAHLARSP
jgi:hypothetical protein